MAQRRASSGSIALLLGVLAGCVDFDEAPPSDCSSCGPDETCENGTSCVPCDRCAPGQCGELTGNCETLHCGACTTEGMSCGAAGVPNRCDCLVSGAELCAGRCGEVDSCEGRFACDECGAGSTCSPLTHHCCGDGILDAGEQCEPGLPGPACASDCTLETPIVSRGQEFVHVTCPGGAAFAWGRDTWSQPGLGGTGFEPDCPQNVDHGASTEHTAARCHHQQLGLAGGAVASFRQIDSGGIHALGIDLEGALWGWGSNLRGRVVGDPATVGLLAVPSPIDPGPGWVRVSAGSHGSAALKDDGSAWSWGGNADDLTVVTTGAMGQGELLELRQPTRLLVPEAEALLFSSVESSLYDATILAVTVDGAVYFAGRFDHVADPGLPQRPEGPTILDLVLVPDLPQAQAVSAGLGFVLLLATDGTLHSFGYDRAGKLGQGRALPDCSDDFYVPTAAPVAVPAGTTFRSISAGADGAAAVDTAGHLWTWGLDNELPTLLGRPVNSGLPCDSTPGQVEGEGFRSVATSELGTVAVKDDGTVWSFGAYRNNSLDDDAPAAVPHQVFSCP